MRVRGSIGKVYALLSRRERVLVMILFGMMVVGAGLETIGVGAIPAFVAMLASPDRILNHSVVRRIYDFLGVASPREFMLYAAGALILIYVFKNVFHSLLIYARSRFVFNRQVGFSERLFESYLRAPYTFHLQHNSAELLRNINNEVNLLVNSYLMPWMTLIMELSMSILLVTMLLVIEPVISLISFVLVGGTAWLFMVAVRSRIREYGRSQQKLRSVMVKQIKQGLEGFKDVRVLGRENYFIRSFVESARQFANMSRYHTVAGALPSPIIESVAVLGVLLVTVLLLLRGNDMSDAIPVLALFAAASIRLMPSMNKIVTAVTSIRFNKYAVDVVYDHLMRLEAAALEGKRAAKHPQPLPFHSQIALHNLRFRYPDGKKDVFRDISLEIPRGGSIAFVGSSGAGKTTLVNLLLGLLRPTEGQILVDGKDIWDDVRAWQENLGYIAQNLYLLDDTIRRNVAFGVEDDKISDEQVWHALELAQLADTIRALPGGLDAMVGEQGVRISGGQRQRIAIARALYHDPQVIVMDEATSSLDSQTERNIVEAIESLRGVRTVIVVAHRLSTVRNCDRLFLIENGRVAASGTFDELLETSPRFRAMNAV